MGYVRDDLTYTPIKGAIVSIIADFSDPTYNFITGSDGYYQIGVPYGNYNLYADKDQPPPPPNVQAPYFYKKTLYSIPVVDNNPVYREILMRRKAWVPKRFLKSFLHYLVSLKGEEVMVKQFFIQS